MSNRCSTSNCFEIVVEAESQLHIKTKRSWTIQLENIASGQKSTSFFLEDPYDKQDYEDLRWYIEDYAATDPYAQAKATRISASQPDYGRALVSTIAPHLTALIAPDDDSYLWTSGPKEVHLMIRGDGTEASLHGLRWEIIERADNHPLEISFFISRTVRPQNNVNLSVSKLRKNDFIDILFVAARPGRAKDISYCSISRLVVQQLKSTSTRSIRLHFCRPGTWKRLRKILRTPGLVYDLVHFDLHGSIAKSQEGEKAVLHFAPPSISSKDPDRKSATAVAKLLADSNVWAVVVNACESAATGVGSASNLAYIFASHGIRYVAAMSNRVKKDTAALAMRSMYASLIHDPDNFPRAVRYARFETRRDRKRVGRYGLQVLCEDEINLVLYSSLQSHNVLSIAAEDSNAELVTEISASSFSNAPQLNRIQDLDILSLEDALERSTVIFLGGESGTGKSTLAKHLTSWWTYSLLAKSVVYFDAIDGLQSSLSAWQQDATYALDESNVTRPDLKNLDEHQITTYERIVLLDNVESYDPWPQNAEEPKSLDTVKQILSKLTSTMQGIRIVVFTRLPYTKLMIEFPSCFYLPISRPSLDEALSITMSSFHHDSININTTQAAELEDIVRDHRLNIGFAKLIMPMIVNSILESNRKFPTHLHSTSYKVLRQQIGSVVESEFVPQFDRIRENSHNLVEELLDDPKACWKTPEWIDESHESRSAFKLASSYFSTWPRTARAMLVPLCMFQQVMPNDIHFWLNTQSKEAMPNNICSWLQILFQESTFKDYDLLSPNPTTDEWTIEQSALRVIDTLTSLGLLRLNRLYSDEDDWSWYYVHPLLPYFLRSELCKMCDSLQIWSLFDTLQELAKISFWNLYKISLLEIADGLEQDLNEEQKMCYHRMLDLNLQNMFEEIRISTSEFLIHLFLQMTHDEYLITIIHPVFNISLWPMPRVLRWARLFQKVLEYFEKILDSEIWCSDGELADVADESFKSTNFRAIFRVQSFIGYVFGALNDMDAASAHAERVLTLWRSSARHFDTDSLRILNDQTLYICEARWVQEAFRPYQDLSVTHLELSLSLLQSSIPDSEPINKDCRFERGFLAYHLSREKHRIPPEYRTLHPLADKYAAECLSTLSAIDKPQTSIVPFLKSELFRYTTNHNHKNAADKDACHFCSSENRRRIRDSFLSSDKSNTPDYVFKAEVYLRNLEESSEETSPIDKQLIREIYERAKQMRVVDLEDLCLQLLVIRARADGDTSAAEGYMRTLQELHRTNHMKSFEYFVRHRP